MALEPGAVPPARMWQRHEIRAIVLPVANRFRQSLFPALSEVVGLGIAADQQCKLEGRQQRSQGRMPQGGTLLYRWAVAPVLVTAWIAKAHGHNGDQRLVIKERSLDAQPLSQPVPGRIIEGEPAFVNPGTGSLSHNQKPSSGACLQHRSRPERQALMAPPAGAGLFEQCL